MMQSNRFRTALIALGAGAALAAVLGFSPAASAQVAPGGPVSDRLTVVDPNGGIFDRLSVFESSEIGFPGNPAPIFYLSDPTLVNPVLQPVTDIVDTNGSISDIFGTFQVNNGLYLGFESAGLTGLPGTATNGIPEGKGGPFDATKYLNPVLVAQGYTANFVSDASGTDFPEPASLSLLGLSGLALLVRRRR